MHVFFLVICTMILYVVLSLHIYSQAIELLNEREYLDRRSLENAYFQFAILKVASWYDRKLVDIPLHGYTKRTLIKICNIHYEAFMNRHSGKSKSFLLMIA